MIRFLDSNSEIILLYVVFAILALTFVVLGIALIGRLFLYKRREYREYKTEQLTEQIIRYISGEVTMKQIKSKLKHKLDFIILLELVNQLEGSLEGKEHNKLNQLIDIDEIRSHFEKWFHSDEPILQAKACLYFAKKTDFPAEFLPRLAQFTGNDHAILCYAATSALIVHGDHKNKTAALKNVLMNKKVSDMALSDLLVQFTKHGDEYHDKEAELIMTLIEDESIPPQRTAVLIRILDELEYFHGVDFLWNYYKSIDKKSTDPEVLKSLISVLTKFGQEKIIQDIHHYFAVSDHANLRRTSAKSLGFFKKKVSIPVLQWLLNDPDFMVRYEAAKALGKFKGINLENMDPPALSKKEWKELSGEIMAEVRQKI